MQKRDGENPEMGSERFSALPRPKKLEVGARKPPCQAERHLT